MNKCSVHTPARMNIWQRLCHHVFGWQYASFHAAYRNYIRKLRWCEDGHWYVLWCGYPISFNDDYHKLTRVTTQESNKYPI